jgi:hypothetical protein
LKAEDTTSKKIKNGEKDFPKYKKVKKIFFFVKKYQLSGFPCQQSDLRAKFFPIIMNCKAVARNYPMANVRNGIVVAQTVVRIRHLLAADEHATRANLIKQAHLKVLKTGFPRSFIFWILWRNALLFLIAHIFVEKCFVVSNCSYFLSLFYTIS